jgi:hypothetical protein
MHHSGLELGFEKPISSYSPLSYAHRQMAWDCDVAVVDLQKFCGLITAPHEFDRILDSPQAVPVGEQQHGGIAVAVAVVIGGFRQLLHLDNVPLNKTRRCNAGLGSLTRD